MSIPVKHSRDQIIRILQERNYKIRMMIESTYKMRKVNYRDLEYDSDDDYENSLDSVRVNLSHIFKKIHVVKKNKIEEEKKEIKIVKPIRISVKIEEFSIFDYFYDCMLSYVFPIEC